MQATIPCECIQRKPSPSSFLVGSEAENPLPISKEKYSENMGLSCLVADDFFSTLGGGK